MYDVYIAKENEDGTAEVVQLTTTYKKDQTRLKKEFSGFSEVGEVDKHDDFNDCRVIVDGNVKFDVERMKTKKMKKIRKRRSGHLILLDGKQMGAEDTGDATKKNQIRDLKRTLRDLPAVAQTAMDGMTPEEIISYEPDEFSNELITEEYS